MKKKDESETNLDYEPISIEEHEKLKRRAKTVEVRTRSEDKKSCYFGVRIEVETIRALEDLAKRDGVSTSEVARRILREAVVPSREPDIKEVFDKLANLENELSNTKNAFVLYIRSLARNEDIAGVFNQWSKSQYLFLSTLRDKYYPHETEVFTHSASEIKEVS